MTLTAAQFRRAIESGIIVSSQAGPGSPLRDSATVTRIAEAAVIGGAAAIRCGGAGGAEDVAAIRAAVRVPVVGLTKEGTSGVYITPSVRSALAVGSAGADVVAADATARDRGAGDAFADIVRAAHDAGLLVMADISTRAEGIVALECGADVVATTLSGYTGNGSPAEGPDLVLVAQLRAALGPDAVIVAEGRYHRPGQARLAIEAGASAVAVGTAITDPAWITASFVSTVHEA
ncbi:MAG: N-acetylmannosamine-6-phosphate 2-epimerase [Acidimicrobiales bacterium]